MRRNIKLRVWSDYDKTFIIICSLVVNEGIDTEFTDKDGHKYTIEQYTGLTDKSGKEIYEGDIVKNIEGINETAVCVWDESNAEFDFRRKDGNYTKDNVKSWLEMYEVIGNIHENPELIGGEE